MNRPNWLLKPIEEYDELPLEQIALQLSRLNRYAGAVEWSVLQHSLLVWDLVKNQSATCQVWALLHDAAECWIGDALLPAKQVAGLAWSNLEDSYNGHIQRLAGIKPDQHELQIVADADKEACRIEMQWKDSDTYYQKLVPWMWLDVTELRHQWINWVLSAISTAIRKPNENIPPQRFKWRTAMRWRFGVCVYLPSFDQWQIDTFGAHDVVRFDKSPWEIIGMLLGGDVREFQWIDNDMGWPQ